MNYQEYNNILRYINNDDIVGLKNYIELEKELNYIDNARKEFVKYMAYQRACYGYIRNYLLITNGYSVYLLNDDEFLSKYYKKKLKDIETLDYQEDLVKAYKVLQYYSNLNSNDVKSVKSNSFKEYLVESNISRYYFSKEQYDESIIFLGGDVNYRLVNDMAAIQVHSSKGKGIVLGLKRD